MEKELKRKPLSSPLAAATKQMQMRLQLLSEAVNAVMDVQLCYYCTINQGWQNTSLLLAGNDVILIECLITLPDAFLFFWRLLAFCEAMVVYAQYARLRDPALTGLLSCQIQSHAVCNMLSLSSLHHGNSRRPAYDALSVTALIGLVTLIFDLLTSK